MATYGVDFLTRLASAVDDFAAAFDAWMLTQQEASFLESRGLFPTVRTRPGVNPQQVRALELAVAEAAGAAAKAVAVTGAYIGVVGLGTLDPIANWSLMSQPKALVSPADIRTAVATIRGRLRAMIADAEGATASDLPAFTPARLHPIVWSAAADHWTIHQYRVAVREAAEALTQSWKTRLGRNNVDDTVFWQQTLSAGPPSVGRPKLVWPGDPADKTVKSMREGLLHLASGLNLTVRNVTTHSRDELGEQEGMERLSTYSQLAHLLDQCTIVQPDDVDGDLQA